MDYDKDTSDFVNMGQSVELPHFLNIDESETSRNKRSIPWVRLEGALRGEGCPICGIVSASVRKRLRDLLSEYVLDVSVRKRLHGSFGFCNHHGWLAADVERELGSDGQHLATLHESLVHLEVRLLREAFAARRRPERRKVPLKGRKPDPLVQQILQVTSPSGGCLICESASQTEEFYASQCVLMCSDDEFRNGFEREGILLCRSHFHTVLIESHERTVADYFLQQQITKLSRLLAHVTLFLEKHDVQRKNEPQGIEWKSWLEALEHYSSKQGLGPTQDPRLLI